MTEPFSKDITQLRQWDQDVWKQTEAQIPENSAIFAAILGVHFDLIDQSHNRHPGRRHGRLERMMHLMAVKCAHLLRAMWIGTITGYPGVRQPLARALFETALTMHYLRAFPEEFDVWRKRDRPSKDERRFWPSAMMKRLALSEPERKLYQVLANAAHPNPTSLSGLGGYDAQTDALETSIGQVLPVAEARKFSANACLIGAVSAYNIARNVEDALVDGLPASMELGQFLQRLIGLTGSLVRDQTQGTPVFDLFDSDGNQE